MTFTIRDLIWATALFAVGVGTIINQVTIERRCREMESEIKALDYMTRENLIQLSWDVKCLKEPVSRD